MAVRVLTAALILIIPTASFAQAAQTPFIPRADVFGGVIFWPGGLGPGGVHFSGALRVGREVGVVGDVIFNDGVTELMGGIRFYVPGRRVSGFAQVLSPIDFLAIQPGIGVDVPVSTRAGLRIAYNVRISADDGSTLIMHTISTGFVMNFGSSNSSGSSGPAVKARRR